MGYDIPLFGDKNVKDIKDTRAVDSDQAAPFGPAYREAVPRQPRYDFSRRVATTRKQS